MGFSVTTILLKVKRRLRTSKSRFVLLRRKIIHRPALFEEGYSIDDNTTVTLFTDHDDIFPGYFPRIRPSSISKRNLISFVLIAVAKNEEATAEEWFIRINKQTHLPNEIIVVDTGSSDGTVKLLRKLASQSPIPFQVIEAPGLNISQGRNLAIKSSNLNFIAVTDFGTKPREDWLEKLMLPFEFTPDIEVSGGWYEAVNHDGEPYRWRKWISLLGKDPQEILSPSVSIAFTRTAWLKVGGYPEWLTLTGEDTYFDLEFKRSCRSWAFSPEALVDWEAPDSTWAYWRKMYYWSIGDGETGMRATAYWYAAIVSGLTLMGLVGSLAILLLATLLNRPLAYIPAVFIISVIIFRAIRTGRKAGYSLTEVILVLGILTSQAMGFIRGALRRKNVTQRRLRTANGLYFILAGIPIDDTGGGARSTQIALELLRRQNIVCYINIFPKSESIDLQLKIRHPNLFTFPAKDFHLKEFIHTYNISLSDYCLGALVELPHPYWIPLITELQQAGANVIYELIDDWETALGQGWFSRSTELKIIQSANGLSATAPKLKDHLEYISQKSVTLLPNAVNLQLFDKKKIHKRPADLPQSKFVIIYTGALYGNWFDWDLLIAIAKSYPQASVVVIGDYRGQCPVVIPNLHFLGLKPQQNLPAYLAFTDVAIIPWKFNEITNATSPLKLYEYLAMNIPVVAPDLTPLHNIPFVYLSKDKDAFINNIDLAIKKHIDQKQVEEFISSNSWESRVNQLVHLFGFEN